MSTRFHALACGTLVSFLALAGCSASTSSTTDENPARVPTVTQNTETPQEQNSAVEDYMAALGSDDPDEMRNGRKFAVRDSVADVYLLHISYATEAKLDSGFYEGETGYARKGDAYETCATDGNGKELCASYEDFKTDGGKLTDFRINGKEPGKLLTVGDGKVVDKKGIGFEFLTAYRSIQGKALWVTVKINSGSNPIGANVYSATYRAPNGKQRQAADGFSPETIDSDSSSIVAMIFPGSTPGGKLTLDGCINECDDTYSVSLNVG